MIKYIFIKNVFAKFFLPYVFFFFLIKRNKKRLSNDGHKINKVYSRPELFSTLFPVNTTREDPIYAFTK